MQQKITFDDLFSFGEEEEVTNKQPEEAKGPAEPVQEKDPFSSFFDDEPAEDAPEELKEQRDKERSDQILQPNPAPQAMETPAPQMAETPAPAEPTSKDEGFKMYNIFDDDPDEKRKAATNMVAQEFGFEAKPSEEQPRFASLTDKPSTIKMELEESGRKAGPSTESDLKTGFNKFKDFSGENSQKKQTAYSLNDIFKAGRTGDVSNTTRAKPKEKKVNYFDLDHDMTYVDPDDNYDGYYEDILPIDYKIAEAQRRNRRGVIIVLGVILALLILAGLGIAVVKFLAPIITGEV